VTRTYDSAPNGKGRLRFSYAGGSYSAGTTVEHTAFDSYDADGQRVRRNMGAGGEVWQVYGMGGELLAEYAANASPASTQKEYGYRGGELLVTAAPAAASGKITPSGATASATYQSYVAANAADGSLSTEWLADGFPPQWVQLDLGQTYNLTKVRLDVSQYPAGRTVHEVYGGPTPGQMTLLGTFDQVTQSGQWLELNTTASGVRYVKVLTTVSPSWVGWVEVEVYGASGADVRWLVSDQLGTPRMVLDKTGSLSGVKRNDYLPYGEELYAGMGGRTSAQGYAWDGVRQQFTGYERDAETGLDYARARYYSASCGRFTAPDPLAASGAVAAPQTWNRYSC
jgi:RHS repeat-associated protein